MDAPYAEERCISSVFISYRRQTAAGEARALFNELVARLGRKAVFMDVDSISLGRDFRSELQKTLAACDLMLVLIDKDWATAKDEAGQIRLENASDFVRMEIEAGLKRDIVVTPVLLKGAQMPTAEQLPAAIRDLAYRHGFELSHLRWQSDVREMLRRLNLDVQNRGRTERDQL
ncbi:TIR domain-containing protein, partial [Bradyrhizobium sp.]|uniref:TIR domain-containing protein n=1 Tax=Bradyrhizobium sp. TaxID=376 RepID=UPI003C1AE1E8